MAKSYIFLGNDKLGSSGPAIVEKILYGKKEEIWKTRLAELYPDIIFENIRIQALLELNEAPDHIFSYPEGKPFLKEIKKKFPSADVRLIEEI